MHNMRNARDMRELLLDAATRAVDYLESLDERVVSPATDAGAALDELDIQLPEEPSDPAVPLEELDRHAAAVMAMSSPRFFGFVIGGTLPEALAANWLA